MTSFGCVAVNLSPISADSSDWPTGGVGAIGDRTGAGSASTTSTDKREVFYGSFGGRESRSRCGIEEKPALD
jgi:hypothetical protein